MEEENKWQSLEAKQGRPSHIHWFALPLFPLLFSVLPCMPGAALGDTRLSELPCAVKSS